MKLHDFFNHFNKELSINRINEKLNNLVMNRNIILISNEMITNENTNRFDSDEQIVLNYLEMLLLIRNECVLIKNDLLVKGNINKFSLIYFIQKKGYDFDILGNIISDGYTIRLWKEKRLNLEELELKYTDKKELEEILKEEYFINKIDYKFYLCSKDINE